MSPQLSLDSTAGIDWENPKLAQLEQFADWHVRGASVRFEYHTRLGMCVYVARERSFAWLKPDLVRTRQDTLEWVVVVDAGFNGCTSARSDAEVAEALDRVFSREEDAWG